jgi:hypothetical protein
MRGMELNAAYSYQHSLTRTVTSGELRIIDGTTGQPVRINDQVAPAINNGTYSGSTHVLSLGLLLRFDEWRAKKDSGSQGL